MKPAERIRLIEEISMDLESRGWPRLQLVLNQFGVHTYNPFNGYNEPTELEYLIQQLQEAGDDQLADIHAYVAGDQQHLLVHPPGSDPWTGMQPARLFLSHIYPYRHRVGAVKKRLAASYGIDAFVAHDNIKPSTTWRAVIKHALATCDMFVAFLDPGFHDSQWCDQECGWALGRNVPILTVRDRAVDRAQVKDGFLEEHQDFLYEDSTAVEWPISGEIFRTLVEDDRTNVVGRRALVEAFVSSPSYDSTRRLWPMIARQSVMETEQLRRLEYAVETNRQVADATYEKDSVPLLVRRFIELFEPPSYDDEPF